MNKNGEGAFLDIVFGIVGAVVGGLTFGLFGAGRVSGFNLYSLIAALIGVVATCLSYNADPSTARAPKPELEQEKNCGPVAGGTGIQHFTIRLRYAGSWRQLRDRESARAELAIEQIVNWGTTKNNSSLRRTAGAYYE